jgi:ABC-type transporter Mla subunit MlaD
MKNSLRTTATVSCALLFATALYAQREERRDDNYWQGRLFQRVHEDLDQIQRDTPKVSSDQYRLVETKRDLEDLQKKMENHGYDQPELDRTISAVERVMADNNMSSRNREMLQEDLRRLRDFREHHDGYR